MPKNATILFDLAHNELLNIHDSDFSEFLNLLNSLSLKINQNEDKNLINKELQNNDILIIGNPIDDYFSNIEIRSIISFVRDGGRLLLISEYGGDYLQNTNLNDISGDNFGIYFQKNIVKEFNKINNNCSSILSIQNFNKHRTTKQLREVLIGGACSLSLNKSSEPLLYTGDSWTEVFNGSNERWLKEKEEKEHIISAFTEYGRGKAVAIGDIDIFSNDPHIGLNCLDNRRFVLNTLSWLLEPIKKADIMVWCLNQLGALQNNLKEMNGKIGNIIETMTLLEKRISALEDDEKSNIKREKRSLEEEEFQFI
jgi:hypothetical protein